LRGWKKIKAAAEYGGVSERTMRDWLKRGLRHTRLPTGTLLIRLDWIDEYLEGFADQQNTTEKIVNAVFRDIKGRAK